MGLQQMVEEAQEEFAETDIAEELEEVFLPMSALVLILKEVNSSDIVFDTMAETTYKFFMALKKQGFTSDQATAIVSAQAQSGTLFSFVGKN